MFLIIRKVNYDWKNYRQNIFIEVSKSKNYYCKLQVTSCKLQVAKYKLQVTNCKLQVTSCKLNLTGNFIVDSVR